MNSYYSIQISEDSHARIPMIPSLSPDVAILLGAVIANSNPSIATLMEERGGLLLGCLLGNMIEGDADLGSPESVSLSKMLVSDIVTTLFRSFEVLEKTFGEAQEEAEAEAAQEPSEPEATTDGPEAEEEASEPEDVEEVN